MPHNRRPEPRDRDWSVARARRAPRLSGPIPSWRFRLAPADTPVSRAPAWAPPGSAAACARLAGRYECRHAGKADVVAHEKGSNKLAPVAGQSDNNLLRIGEHPDLFVKGLVIASLNVPHNID